MAPVIVRGDEVRRTQVVANLLDNAAKYTQPGGHIDLRVSADDDRAEVAVTDTGVGMRPADIDGMFSLFVQGERSPDRAEGGLGLGLSLVQRIVAMHGGEAGAESEGPGRGSRFLVRLPRVRGAVAASGGEPELAATKAVAGARVLVVDDNDDAAAARAQQPARERVWVAVTGYGQETDRQRTRTAGFDVHLTKPVDARMLRAALGRLLCS